MNDSLSVLRRYRWPLLGAAAALFLVGVLLWNLRGRGPDPRLAAIRQQGYPVTAAELDAWYPRVPDTQNVALVYAKVFALPLLAKEPCQFERFKDHNWLLPRGEHLAPKDKAKLAGLLSTNEALLRPLYTAAGPCRYPVDLTKSFDTQLPHLARCKAAVQLLVAAAMLHADNGENERALEDCAAAARLAESLNAEPLLISQLVRLACWNLLLKRLETMVNLGSFKEEHLARLQRLIEPVERPQAMVRAMAGERVCGLSIFANPEYCWFGMVSQDDTPPTFGQKLRTRVLIDGLKASGFFAKDRAFYLNVLSNYVAAAQAPLPERLQAGQRAGSLMPPHRLYLFSSMILPSLVKVFDRDADICARHRATQAALAIERFRRAHTNALPATLEELVPAYLSAVPTGPYDGKPLRYKLRQPGYVAYSLGPDGIDHGGLEAPPNTPNAPHDITFILEK